MISSNPGLLRKSYAPSSKRVHLQAFSPSQPSSPLVIRSTLNRGDSPLFRRESELAVGLFSFFREENVLDILSRILIALRRPCSHHSFRVIDDSWFSLRLFNSFVIGDSRPPTVYQTSWTAPPACCPLSFDLPPLAQVLPTPDHKSVIQSPLRRFAFPPPFFSRAKKPFFNYLITQLPPVQLRQVPASPFLCSSHKPLNG